MGAARRPYGWTTLGLNAVFSCCRGRGGGEPVVSGRKDIFVDCDWQQRARDRTAYGVTWLMRMRQMRAGAAKPYLRPRARRHRRRERRLDTTGDHRRDYRARYPSFLFLFGSPDVYVPHHPRSVPSPSHAFACAPYSVMVRATCFWYGRPRRCAAEPEMHGSHHTHMHAHAMPCMRARTHGLSMGMCKRTRAQGRTFSNSIRELKRR